MAAIVVMLWSAAAEATITQGDLSIYGFLETREAGRWGEGSSNDNAVPTTFLSNGAGIKKQGVAATENGGSFDFNHWDLVEARQLMGLRPDYHLIKNHKLLGRFDIPFVEDADFFAYYRPWYDAEGTLKSKGRAEPFRDWTNYTQRQLQEQYFRNDLHEYYAQLNLTDNLSLRLGKQQIIWSEANLLSGTDITNPGDVSYHGFVGAESPEDARKALQMMKMTYALPDLIGTSNNELEGFWIPGDFEGASSLKSNLTPGLTEVSTDPRNPYAIPVSLEGPFSGAPNPFSLLDPRFAVTKIFNQEGEPVRITSLLDLPQKPMVAVALGGPSNFFDLVNHDVSNAPSKSILNSEFGLRFSSVLPVGDGLQTSFIFLYEARSPLSKLCVECAAPPGFTRVRAEPNGPNSEFIVPGLFPAFGKFAYGRPQPGFPKSGTFLILSSTDYRRNPYFGLTGTYYDKTLTDAVFRYDTLFAPREAVSAPTGPHGGTFGKWTEFSRIVLGIDRPTIVPFFYPYFTKQHTLFTLETTETFYPDLPHGAIPNDPLGKIRRVSTFLSLTATNFVLNGKGASETGVAWDADDQTGQIVSSNSYRWSRNVLIGTNVDWYIGRSGRHTDPFLESKSQRINEIELTLTYEL